MNVDERWRAVDQLVTELLVPMTDVDRSAQQRADEAGLPTISVTPPQAHLLALLVRIAGARRVLEIGTLAGQSAIAMARALPPEGRLVTLEIDPGAAEVARANFAAAGVDDRAEVVVGPALATLADLDPAEPFDLVFIDADKEGYPDYLTAVLPLTHPGSVLVADNVVRDGALADDASEDSRVIGVRRYLELVASDERLDATVIQTVGAKGYDGFCLAVVR
ncbi:MAG TPA: O-methyltransferase [Mycobacteriales bacterium]|jgi:predicted O-methyltransferase YrrM|nr:O-methyltransferase [Mycobacteriales bacterium]